MTTILFADLARCATARAHLAGAESMAAERLAREAFEASLEPDADADAQRRAVTVLCRRWDAARTRYWRELAAAATLTGHPWPAAEQLGGQP